MAEDIKDLKVTILMPVYNGERYLREAIVSMLNQTFTNFEFLIINDGSTDGSEAIIKSYNDKRIRLVNNEKNLGIVETLNKGIGLAKGEYIARMDADDVSLPERLEKQVEFLDRNPSVCVVAAHITLVDEQNRILDYCWTEDMLTRTEKEIYDFLPKENCIAHPTVMMRKSVISTIGYNKLFINSEDWGLWLMLISEGKIIAKIDEILVKYRIHAESITVKNNTKKPFKNILRFKRRYLKYKISKLQLKGPDYKVLRTYLAGSARFYFPFLYVLAGKLYSTRPLHFLKQFIQIRKEFGVKNKTISHIFFFPFAHIGGAERVHAVIVETVAYRNPVVIITDSNVNSTNCSLFPKSTSVLSIRELLNWPFTKKWVIKKMFASVQNNKKVYLFGANSFFFYYLLSKLPEETNAIDLIHAFMHEYEVGAEKWSIPVVYKLKNRIVISKKTALDLAQQYARKKLPEELTKRIVCINNFTPERDFVKKELTGNIKVLYSGRGTHEKRVELISNAARILSEKNAPVEFHFAGNVKGAIPMEDLPYCILHGEIRDDEVLNSIYSQSHILLVTSSREGFPMVIMEAMMNGAVPVSTPVGGIGEHIKSNINGVLLKTVNPTDVVREIVAILEYFIHHREELNAISENARQYAMSNFGKEKFVAAYQNIIDRR